MTQANASRQRSSNTPMSSSTLRIKEENRGEFFFELDNFLQWVTDFDREPKSFGSSGLTATGDHREFVDMNSGRADGDEMLLDEEVSEILLIGGGGCSRFGAMDTNKQPNSSVHNRNYRKLHSLDEEYALRSPVDVCQPINPSNLGECESAQGSSRHQSSEADEKMALSPTTTEEPKKRNQNLSRKRQREEIEHLRVCVKELQSQLEMLLSGDGVSDGDASYRPVLKKEERQVFLQEALAWKRAAASEKQQSELAAVENLKLRTRINENLLVCKNLRETSAKCRFTPSPGGSTFGHVSLNQPLISGALSDSATFDALQQGLDAQYKHLSAIWSECNFKNTNVEIKRSNWMRSEGDHFFLEHTKSHMFPFTPDAVTCATWKLTQGGLLTSTNGELKIRRVMGNTMYATVTDKIPLLDAQDSTVKVWIVLKRFIEDHQVVIVWRGVVEIERSKRIRMAERGWNVVRSIPNTMEANQRGLTTAPCVSQTCIRATLETNCAAREDELDAGSLTARVMSQYYQNMSMLDQTIENLLVDESLTSGGSCGGLGSASGTALRQWNIRA